MDSFSESPESIIAQARDLIERAQAALEAGEESWRSQGPDAQKLRDTLHEYLDLQGQEQAQREFQADMQAVEQEAQQAYARRFQPVGAAGGIRRRHFMV